MSTRLIVSAVVGVAVGYFAGPQAGIQAFSLTYGVTGSLDPNKKVQGPRLDDLKMASASYGAPVAYVEGHPRIAGNIVWSTDKREVATETSDGGKGGPGVDTTIFTYEVDLIIMLAENPGFRPRRCWSNGALIWSAADDADTDTLTASGETISWRELRVYTGAPDQMPDPTYEAAVGVGNAPAYRDRSCIVIVGLNCGQSGQLPILTWEISDGAVTPSGHSDILNAPQYPDGADTVSPPATLTLTHPELITWSTDPSLYSVTLTRSSSFPKMKYDSSRMDLSAYPADDVTLTVKIQIGTTIGSTLPGDTTQFLGFNNGMDDQEWALRCVSAGVIQAYTFFERGGSGATATAHSLDGVARDEQGFIRFSIVFRRATDTDPDLVQFLINDDVVRAVNGMPSAGSYVQLWLSNGSGQTVQWIKAKDLRMYVGAGTTFDTVVLHEPTLEDVVRRQWLRAGLDLAFLDASALASKNVRAMAVSQVTSPRQVIDTLSSAYLFECVESGAIVRMTLRGGAAVLTIPYDDLGASSGDPIDAFPRTRGNELELPAQVSVKFANIDDDYQDGNESSTRLATGSSIVTTVEVPLGFTPIEAKRLADASVTDALASIVRFGPVGLTRKYAAIEPTDVLLITGKGGSTYRVRVLKRTDSDGIATIEGVFDDATAINSSAITSGGYNSTTIVRSASPTTELILDIAPLRSVDVGVSPVFYSAAKPSSTERWDGYGLYRSADGVTYAKLFDSTTQAVTGTASTVLGDFTGGFTVDSTSTVRVDVGNGELSSITSDELLDSVSNVALIGDEIVQFRDATLVSAGIYDLGGQMLRGLLGTEWAKASHVVGERFVLLTPTTLRAYVDDLTTIGVAYDYKTVTFGRSVAGTTAQAFTNAGVNLKPFARIDLSIDSTDPSNPVLSWNWRSRYQSRLFAPIVNSEPDLSFDIELRDNTDALIASATVTNAMQWTSPALSSGDYFTVWKRGVLGRGYAATLEIA